MPLTLAILMVKSPGNLAPGKAQGTRRPTATLGAPQTMVVGVPLPLVSYGGTALVTLCLATARTWRPIPWSSPPGRERLLQLGLGGRALRFDRQLAEKLVEIGPDLRLGARVGQVGDGRGLENADHARSFRKRLLQPRALRQTHAAGNQSRRLAKNRREFRARCAKIGRDD